MKCCPSRYVPLPLPLAPEHRVVQGVARRLQDTKALAEVEALKEFMHMLTRDPDRAYYGYDVSGRSRPSAHRLLRRCYAACCEGESGTCSREAANNRFAVQEQMRQGATKVSGGLVQ